MSRTDKNNVLNLQNLDLPHGTNLSQLMRVKLC